MKDLILRGIDGETVRMPGQTLERLEGAVRGPMITQDHGSYERVRRIFNSMIDRRPGLIVRCAGAADVVRAIGFVRDHGLLCAVRGGGHSIGGKSLCEGGVLIDLSVMKGIRVDPARRTARAQPGLRLGELDRETHAFGLATPTGIVSDTGIAGLTLGGGLGWLNGRFGLACDNVRAFDVVTADGRLRTASAGENPDLFWGLRGGGGNLGIVTSFEYALHPLETVLGGQVLHPAQRAREVLRFFDDFSRSAPDELSTAAAFLPHPDGDPLLALVVCYSGPLEEAQRVMEPLRRHGSPIGDTIEPIPYVAMQSSLDPAFPPERHHYWKSHLLPSPLDDAAIEVLESFAARRPSPHTVVALQQMHGAASRVAPAESAFPHRREQYDLLLLGQWEEGDDAEENVAWARDFWDAMRPFAHGVYVNNLGEEGDAAVRDAYGENFDRLAELKQIHDPDNILRSNQNVRPGGTAQRQQS